MSRCALCAAEQLPNSLFCDHCGNPLVVAPTPSTRTASTALPALRFGGSGLSLTLPPGDRLVMGRASRSGGAPPAIPLDAEGRYGVSRRHALLTRVGRALFIEDLGSRNGTWLNGQRLPPSQRVSLGPGDTLRLGLLEIVLVDG